MSEKKYFSLLTCFSLSIIQMPPPFVTPFFLCDQIRKLRIWSHLLKKSLMENFIFCVVTLLTLKCVKSNFGPFHATCSFLYIPPKNIMKLLFFMFSGGIERRQWHEIGLKALGMQLISELCCIFPLVTQHIVSHHSNGNGSIFWIYRRTGSLSDTCSNLLTLQVLERSVDDLTPLSHSSPPSHPFSIFNPFKYFVPVALHDSHSSLSWIIFELFN